MGKPVAVLISDIHFTVQTLEIATESLLMAINKAMELKVSLVIAGDLLDSKAIIRAECLNRLIDIFNERGEDLRGIYVLPGNHDKVNEKSLDHSLSFLPTCFLIDHPRKADWGSYIGYMLPYFNDSADLLNALKTIPLGSRIIMHQGVQTAHMGHYVQDKTSLPPEAFADYRVISGHYHRRQDIKCGRPRKNAVGLFSYIGNPYTLSFGEANDGPKGFQILKDDGLLEFVPTNLRKHVIIERDISSLDTPIEGVNPEDLVWFKLTGTKSQLAKIKKKDISQLLNRDNFKLDLIATESEKVLTSRVNKNNHELLDDLIEKLDDSTEHKNYLKQLWREIL